MPKLLFTAFCLLLTISLTGCGETKFKTEEFYAMGTFVSLTLPEKSFDKASDIRASLYRLESIVTSGTESANKTQNFAFTGIMKELFKTGEEYSDITNGRFSVFAYTISSLYGFHEGPFKMPSEEELEKAMNNIDNGKNVLIDMGAYAKGYIVDKTIDNIKIAGISNAMLNAGGDLYALGTKGERKWRVAVKHPEKKGEFLSVLNLQDTALATSGDYERFFINENGEKIYHIFDATTGRNPNFYKSVSVIADTAVQADGLATVFFLIPETDIKRICKNLSTPVLLYTVNGKTIKLCGWEKYEDN